MRRKTTAKTIEIYSDAISIILSGAPNGMRIRRLADCAGPGSSIHRTPKNIPTKTRAEAPGPLPRVARDRPSRGALPRSIFEIEGAREVALVVTTPGSGFGPSGEGFIRFSAFGHRADVVEAVRRLKESTKNTK